MLADVRSDRAKSGGTSQGVPQPLFCILSFSRCVCMCTEGCVVRIWGGAVMCCRLKGATRDWEGAARMCGRVVELTDMAPR